MKPTLLATWILCAFAIGATSPARCEDFVCKWTSGPIVIDGKADDVAWQQAQLIENFRIPATAGTIPMTSTRARLLWDREHMYFVAELEDHDLFADIVEHDGKTWENDVFEIFLKPSMEATGYFELQVNAAGTRMDMFLPDRNRGGYQAFKDSDTFKWTTQVQRSGTLNVRNDRDERWTVEGKIPWTDFMPSGGRPDVGETWRMALCRYDYSLNQPPELSSCAPLSKLNFHLLEDYAPLRFAGPSESDSAAKAMSDRKRFVESKVVGSPEPPLPYRTVRAFPNLKLELPIDVQVEPGTRRFFVLEEKGVYGPSVVKRTRDDPLSSELDLIADPKGVAYSLAFHPKYPENGYLYVGSNVKSVDGIHRSQIVRYTLGRTEPFEVVGDPLTIIDWESNGHNGVAITFGLDGMMYVTSGDGTSDSDANNAGQDLSKLLAKVLRIDVDHPEPGKAYSVPHDNPFVNTEGARPETWAYGLRNPWRMTTDSKSGNIWVGNNGQDVSEQVYLLAKGANYGWSVYEGSLPFYPQRKLGPTPHVKPTVEHPHSESRSLTGGVVYHGKRIPELRGAYVYGDHSTGKIWGLKHDGQKILWHRELADTPFNITAISIDPDGELIVVDHRGESQGGLYHLEPSPAPANPSHFPTQLSQTGLFDAVANHEVADGLIPYSVNAPFWSDNAIKSRFIALPKNGSIGLKDRWAWEFPESTVLVKSFQLEMKAGDSNSRRWIETRLMTKQQGEWVGYSYAWNQEQTEATLVEASGRDHLFEIDDSNGSQLRQQLWRYPSRTECMVCHTRAAGFVLGLSTHQMNKTHDYGHGVVMNQLEALEAMELLRNGWHSPANDSSKGKPQLPIRSNKLLAQRSDQYAKLVNPYDPAEKLESRARAFLHSNCAYCHVESGGGNAKMDLSIYAATASMNIMDVVPTHHTFGKSRARLVAPGDPENSIVLHRIGIREPGQMPQLGTSLVDRQATSLLQQWILESKTTSPQP